MSDDETKESFLSFILVSAEVLLFIVNNGTIEAQPGILSANMASDPIIVDLDGLYNRVVVDRLCSWDWAQFMLVL
jgi:hypothetical protein